MAMLHCAVLHHNMVAKLDHGMQCHATPCHAAPRYTPVCYTSWLYCRGQEQVARMRLVRNDRWKTKRGA